MKNINDSAICLNNRTFKKKFLNFKQKYFGNFIQICSNQNVKWNRKEVNHLILIFFKINVL